MPKRYSNYTDIEAALRARESFTGNSATGVRVDEHTTFNCGMAWYSVYSYSTKMLTYDLQTHEVTYYNPKRYSRTTSRLQALLRLVFRDEIAAYMERENGA